MRADARRNVDSLLRTALEAFAESGVDAPVRAIAERAGVGTLYRHFPQRSDLIVAVFQHEADACGEAAPILAAKHESGEALELAAALNTGDPAYEVLPAYFERRLRPALLCTPPQGSGSGNARRMVELLVDGLRFGGRPPRTTDLGGTAKASDGAKASRDADKASAARCD